jgi:hypothetical protein
MQFAMSFVSARDFLVSDDKFPTCCFSYDFGITVIRHQNDEAM